MILVVRCKIFWAKLVSPPQMILGSYAHAVEARYWPSFFVLCSAGKFQRGVYSQIYFDVSPGNGRQALSENRTQGGKSTLSESSKKYSS